MLKKRNAFFIGEIIRPPSRYEEASNVFRSVATIQNIENKLRRMWKLDEAHTEQYANEFICIKHDIFVSK